MHKRAPANVPVSVIEPAAHGRHKSSRSAPVVERNLPALQPVQAATFDAVEYLPVAHAVHVVAPAVVPVFVMEPAAQVVQDATFDAVE